MAAADDKEKMATADDKEDKLMVAATKINNLPEFWTDDPKAWFARVDAIFVLNGISKASTKFTYMLAHAPKELIPYVSGLIDESLPDSVSKYDVLKKRVIQGFSISEEAKLRILFKGQSLGDSKPSQFLVQLKNMAAGNINDTVLKSLFLEHLPDNVRAILAVSDSQTVDNLALLADKIMENQTPTYSVNTVGNSSSFEELQKQVEILADQVKKLSAIFQKRNRSRSKTRPTNKQREWLPNFNKAYCYPHNKYGAQARFCKPPCTWSNQQEN